MDQSPFSKLLVRLLCTAVLAAFAAGPALAQDIGTVEVRGVSPRDVAEDTTGVFDEVSSGLNVVGVEEKVYLEALPRRGLTIGGATWELTGRPTGSQAELSDTEGTLVTLRPDVAGLYLVEMTPLDPALEPMDPVVQRVYAGVWVGAGVFSTHGMPDASIPSCANSCCHLDSDQPRLNVVDNWVGTAHADKLQSHLRGERGGGYEESCLSCHTLGFKDSAANRGFDDVAASIGFGVHEVVALINEAAASGTDNWPELPEELQRHASIQCESCHGPGSQHLGFILEPDVGIAGVDMSTKQCAQCHDSATPFGDRFYQWTGSSHPVTQDASQGNVAANNTCRTCHTGEGFVYGLAKGEPIPQMPAEDYHGITCSACHDPHGSEHPSSLRLAGATAIPSGDVYHNAGTGGLCVNCHNTRSTNGEVTAVSSFRGAHYGAQGDMMLGVNMAAFGLPVIGNSAHTNIVHDTCTTCHMAESDNEYVGGHTFAMRHPADPPGVDIINAANACSSCHPGLTDTYDLRARGDYDGNGLIEGVQTEVMGLLDLLRPGLLALPGASAAADGSISIAQAGWNTWTDDQKRAAYNFNYIVKDGSYGIHNTSYTVQMLQRSYYGVYGRPITDDYPRVDLRGPVQPSQVEPPDPTPTPVPTPTPGEPGPQEFLAEIQLLGVSPREVAMDESGVFDETASGLRNIGVGERVYMEAVPKDPSVIGYNWSILSRPAASTAALSATTGEMVTFRPDARGIYLIRLTPETTGKEVIEVYDQRIYASEWVGAGVFGDGTPRAPQCGTGFCHGPGTGNPELNVRDDWMQSTHAQKLQSHMNGEKGVEYDVSCLPCHTVGFNTHVAAINGGFDDIAAMLGYDLQQIPALVADAIATGNDNFNQLPSELRNHASVQCESCHGAGGLHPANLSAFDKGIDGVNLSSAQCAQCHDSAMGHANGFYQWTGSSHPVTQDASQGNVAANNTCRSCHTGEGFVAVHAKNAPIPQKDPSEYHGITCASCHDPHNSEHPNQLRVSGDFVIPSGERPYTSGTGGMCFRCHNSRVANGEATALSSFRGAHSSTQADMLLGTTGTSFGLGFAPNSAHAVTVPNTCSACHMAPGVGEEDDLTPPLVGEHTFAMRDVQGNPNDPSAHVINAQNACATCHTGLDTYDLVATGDYDGNGVVEGVQTEVRGLLAILRAGILENMAGTTLNASGTISINAGNFANLTDDQKRALYNYNFVVNDGSYGVHNTAYAVQLLQRAYYGVYGKSILDDYPSITLRGPVQEASIPNPSSWIVW